MAAEDDWDDTIVPRLMAAGADLSKVHGLVLTADIDGTKTERDLSLDHDTATLEQFLRNHPAIRLVVIDPVSNYLGRANMVDEQSVRSVLAPLKGLANRLHVAIICVMHLNKKVELDAIHRISGAMAFVGVARMVWLCAPKPTADGKPSDESVMVKVKGNIVQRKLKGLLFTTKVRYLTIESKSTPIAFAEWLEKIDPSADELVSGSRERKKPPHRPAEPTPASNPMAE